MLFGFEIDMREKKRPIKNKIDNLQHHLLPKLSAITTYFQGDFEFSKIAVLILSRILEVSLKKANQ